MSIKSKAKLPKIKDTDEAWDSRELGNDERFAEVSEEDLNFNIDRSLELQLTSIRLPVSLIDDFKMIAEYHGNGYKPLMRQVLKQFAEAEIRRIAKELLVKEPA